MEYNRKIIDIENTNEPKRVSIAVRFLHDLESVRTNLGQLKSSKIFRESIQSAVSCEICENIHDQNDLKWGEMRKYIEEQIQAKNWDQLREDIFEHNLVLFFTLIECKAPEDILNSLMEFCDDDAMASVCGPNYGVIELEGMFLLHEACRNNYSSNMVKKIFEYYPDALTLKDQSGMTPLDIVRTRDCDNSGAEVYFCIERLIIENVPSQEKAKYFRGIDYHRLIRFGTKLEEVQVGSIDDAKYVFHEFMKFQGRQVST